MSPAESKLLGMGTFSNILGLRLPCISGVSIAFAAAGLAACSSVPAKFECKEIQARMDYGNLSDDQKNFAQMELDECRQKLRQAQFKDSTRLNGLEKKVSPSSDSL